MFGKNNNDERFEVIYKQSSLGSNCKILRDKNTGVNYIYYGEGYGGGITVLVDKNGNPVIT